MNTPLHTPAKLPFSLPAPALAHAIEAEWTPGKKYSPSAMPLTALAFTAIDQIAGQEEGVIEALLVYVDTDTLSYRAGSSEPLKKLQDEEWGAVLKWAGARFDAIWQTTSGVMPVEQPAALHEAIARYLRTLDAFRLSAFCVLASGFSSIVLALAVCEKYLDGAQAFALSRLEEEAQAEQWGRDAQADARAGKMQEEILAAERFLRLLDTA